MNKVTADIMIENGAGAGNDETIYSIIEMHMGWNCYHDNQEINERNYRFRQILFKNLLEDRSIDCSKFYNTKGAKITRDLKKLLTEMGVPKDEIANVWPQICAAIGDLYIQVHAKAVMSPTYFETAKMGNYGDSDSCFQQGGCNQYNGTFIDVSPACGVLLVHPDRPPADLTERQRQSRYGRARMICYVENATTAWLINAYHQYSRREIPKNIMVRALEALSGAKIKFNRSGSDESLPIFINHPPLRCEAIEGNFNKLTTDYRWACPSCNRKFDPSQVVTDLDNNTYMIGCSQKCCNEQSEYERYECYQCGHGVIDDEVRFVEGDAYCPDCYYENYRFCENCNNDYPREDAVEIVGYRYDNYVCSSCAEEHAGECEDCEQIVWNLEGDYCNECLQHYSSCEQCGELVHHDNVEKDKYGNPYCEDCWEDITAEEATA